MALGDTYDNNKKTRDVNTYSLTNFANPEGVDPSKLSVDFWGKLLKLQFSPKLESNGGDFAKYDHKNAAVSYLSHFKARMLADLITKFIQDPASFDDNLGITTKNAFISINKSVSGSKGPCLVLKVFNDSGQIESSYAYEFKTDFHYYIKDFKDDMDGDFDKFYDNNIELMAFGEMLADFARFHNGAAAHFNLEYGKFENSKIQSKLNSVAKKLGIEWAQEGFNGGSGGGSRTTSAFDSKPGKSYSMDDLG